MPDLKFSGLSLRPLDFDGGTSRFDLTLSILETEQGLIVELKYSTDLFNADTIVRMAGHFETLLEGIVSNPEQRILDLPLSEMQTPTL
jgi:non-ribosomal peptide synthetase component F